MLKLDLSQSRQAADFVQMINDRRIVHVAYSGKQCVAYFVVKLVLEPILFQTDIISKKAKHLAARRRVICKRADLRVDQPRRRAFACLLYTSDAADE